MVLAFVAQAVIGVSLLRTDLLAEGVGWAAIVWNVGWLILLILVSRHDVYFPVLHHMIPLVIGVSLLASR